MARSHTAIRGLYLRDCQQGMNVLGVREMITQLVHVAPAVQHVERFAQDLGQNLVRTVRFGVDQEPDEQFERAQRLRGVGLERLKPGSFHQPARSRTPKSEALPEQT